MHQKEIPPTSTASSNDIPSSPPIDTSPTSFPVPTGPFDSDQADTVSNNEAPPSINMLPASTQTGLSDSIPNNTRAACDSATNDDSCSALPLSDDTEMKTTDLTRYFDQVPLVSLSKCPNPGMPPERKTDRIHITLTDSFDYERSWIKTENETLGSLATSYAKYSGLKEDDFFLQLRTVPISSFEAIHTLPIMNGDIITVIINIAKALPFHTPYWIIKLLQLSPKDRYNRKYDHYEGETTRMDERLLRILLSHIWPGMPTVAIDCRSSKHLKAKDILKTIREGLHREDIVWEDEDFLDTISISSIAPEINLLTLEMTWEPPESMHESEVSWHYPTGPSLENQSIQWIITNKAGLEVPGMATIPAMHEWIKTHFGLETHPTYLTHGLNLLSAGCLTDLGFKKDHKYEVSIHTGYPPILVTPSTPTGHPFHPNVSIRSPTSLTCDRPQHRTHRSVRIPAQTD
ncbi:hypothetical protein CF319_g7682 [Tilletia indica]|nr:hypothetical protein CF319_g7682 [Tilletia indica]